MAHNIRTEWTFAAQTPSSGNVAPPYACIGTFFGDRQPCAWVPLINQILHLPVALNDTTPAGREFQFSVTASSARPSGAATVAGVTASASFNDGKTWVPAAVHADGQGTFGVSLLQPALQDTTGAVSLRIEAWDVDGNRVVQTIDRAYGLS